MFSLRQFIPVLSEIIGNVSETALYERQRELVRAGVLNSAGGRGPRSGVPLTPDSVAALTLSLLATDNLSEIGVETKFLCQLGRVDFRGEPKSHEDAKNLRQYVSAALQEGTPMLQRLFTVEFNRSQRTAETKLRGIRTAKMFIPARQSAPKGNLFITAKLRDYTFVELFNVLHNGIDVPSKLAALREMRRSRDQEFADFIAENP
jgi:hypothetical protein